MQNPFEQISAEIQHVNTRLNHLEELILSVKKDLNSYDELIVNGVVNVLNSVKNQEPQQTAPVPRYLNSAEAADYLGVSRSAIYQYIYRIPYTKKKDKLYFLNTDLDDYLKNKKR
jgi:hypothetical protein